MSVGMGYLGVGLEMTCDRSDEPFEASPLELLTDLDHHSRDLEQLRRDGRVEQALASAQGDAG